jgi:hypothetical protein
MLILIRDRRFLKPLNRDRTEPLAFRPVNQQLDINIVFRERYKIIIGKSHCPVKRPCLTEKQLRVSTLAQNERILQNQKSLKSLDLRLSF